MRFSMLYSEQILSFKPCLIFYAGDSLNSHPLFQKSAYGPESIGYKGYKNMNVKKLHNLMKW